MSIIESAAPAERIAASLAPAPATVGEVRTEPLKARLRMGAIWVVVGRSLGIGVTIAANMVLARLLSPEDFGGFLLFGSVLAMGSLLAMAGLNTAVIRFVSGSLGRGDRVGARQALRRVMLAGAASITLVTAASVVGLSIYGPQVLGVQEVPGIVPLAAVSLALLALLQLAAEACRSLHEMRWASLFSGGQTGGLLSNLLFLSLIAASLLFLTPNLGTAVALNAVAMGITLPLALVCLLGSARARLHTAQHTPGPSTLTYGQLLGFSLPMLLIQLLTFTATNADLWIAGVNCEHDQLALYGAARRLMLIVTMPLQMLVLTVISSIADLHGQGRSKELEAVLRRATTLAALPSVGAIVLLMCCGGPILELVFGAYFRHAALPLAILGCGQLALVLAGTCGSALEMTGYQLVSLLVNLLTAVLLVTIGTWAARQYGILGLATASASIVMAQSLTMWLLARRLVGVWTHPTLALSSVWGKS